MNIAEFKQQVVDAFAEHFPEAKTKLEERHGIELRCRIEIDDKTLIDVYYSATTGKTSYLLVKTGKRIFGYDNFRSWHRHPKENPEDHVACQEPNPSQALGEMKEIVNLKSPI